MRQVHIGLGPLSSHALPRSLLVVDIVYSEVSSAARSRDEVGVLEEGDRIDCSFGVDSVLAAGLGFSVEVASVPDFDLAVLLARGEQPLLVFAHRQRSDRVFMVV